MKNDVIPAQAGIQAVNRKLKRLFKTWVPAFTGTTVLLVSLISLKAAEQVPANLAEGKATFELQCARCHGMEGKGDGMDAKRLPVVPRDLTSGIFKFQSTQQGTPPSDEDLLWTLNHGMSGAGMPSFASLALDVKKNLVAYVKTLSPAFNGMEPKALPTANMRAKVDLKKGKELYDKLQCALCHGKDGQANGTSAAALKDSWQRPLKPANLTHGWAYRAGDSAEQIYNRLMAGINGAPMPSYADAVSSPNDAWQLANYVTTLQLKTNWIPEIMASKVKDLPKTFDDDAWRSAQRTDVNLQSQTYSDGKKFVNTVSAVSVQALFNDTAVTFRIFWSDPTLSEKNMSDSFVMAIKPGKVQLKHNQNLNSMYAPNDPSLELYQWTASRPMKVRVGLDNLYAVNQGALRTMMDLDSAAEYRDGLWTLMVTRPLTQTGTEELGKNPVRVGFGASDGDNNETGTRRAASQWIALVFGQTENHH